MTMKSNYNISIIDFGWYTSLLAYSFEQGVAMSLRLANWLVLVRITCFETMFIARTRVRNIIAYFSIEGCERCIGVNIAS